MGFREESREYRTSVPGSNLGPTRLPGLRRSLSRSLDRLGCTVVSAIEVEFSVLLKPTHKTQTQSISLSQEEEEEEHGFGDKVLGFYARIF